MLYVIRRAATYVDKILKDAKPGDLPQRYTCGMNPDVLAAALELSPRDRLQLIEALWDTLSEDDIPVTAEERALLDARLADLETNPGDQSPWPEVRARLDRRTR